MDQQYDDPHQKSKAFDRLSNLRQGKLSVRDYHMEFNRLEIQSGEHFGETAKKSMFLKGLHAKLQEALATVDEDLSYEQLINKAIRTSDNLYRVGLTTRARQGHTPVEQPTPKNTRTPSPPEKMDWEPTKAGKASTRASRPSADQIRCYACGEKGHISKYCGKSPKARSTKVSRAARREPLSDSKDPPKDTDEGESDDSGKE
ncbi:hypothetical protein P3342_007496 [Pyrenophora teres f. teres]|nr:hypothetical protein P3342_007496 [Pyrenophora teres f. teres]